MIVAQSGFLPIERDRRRELGVQRRGGGLMPRPRVGISSRWRARIGVGIEVQGTRAALGGLDVIDLDVITSRELFKEYGLDPNTVDFIGHALAL